MFSMSARLLSIYHYLDDSKNLQTDLNQNNQVDVFSFHKEEGMLWDFYNTESNNFNAEINVGLYL